MFVLNLISVMLIANTQYGFTQPTTIAIGAGGVKYSSPVACNNIFASIPLLGGLVAFLEHAFAATVNPTATYCLAQAGAVIIYTYDPTTAGGNTFAITNLFVDLIPLALVAVVLVGFNVAGSGYNSGAVMTMVIGGGLMMAWAILSAPVLGLFLQVNYDILTLLFLAFYAVLSLIFAVNALRTMGGGGSGGGGSDL
jgi:hypothetical protein